MRQLSVAPPVPKSMFLCSQMYVSTRNSYSCEYVGEGGGEVCSRLSEYDKKFSKKLAHPKKTTSRGCVTRRVFLLACKFKSALFVYALVVKNFFFFLYKKST
jgi:hypothetical protein